jgi:hypothetical protein
MLLILANTITPFIAADFIYLFIANSVIGLIEAALLERWFAGGRRAIWWLIPANYLSAWAGLLLITWLLTPHMNDLLGPKPIERVNLVAAGLLLLSYLLSVVLEFGFVYLASRPDRRSVGRAAIATICVNAASYLLVFLLFMFSYSLPFNARVRPLSDLGNLPAGTLYWVDSSGRVIARDLNRGGPDRMAGQVEQTSSVLPCQLRIERSANQERAQMSVAYGYSGPVAQSEPDPLVLADVGSVRAFPTGYWDQPRFPLRKTTFDLRTIEHRSVQISFDWGRKYLSSDVPSYVQKLWTTATG